MTTKKWISLAIVVAVIIGSLALVKLLPFWATLACLVSLGAGFTAGYLFKRPEEFVANVVDADEVIEKFKEWFSSLTSNGASKAVAAAKKTVS